MIHRRGRLVLGAGLAAVLAVVALVTVSVGGFVLLSGDRAASQAMRDDIREALLAAHAPPSVTAFYQARGYQPFWVRGATLRPEARQLVAMATPSQDPGASLSLAPGRPDDLARVEIALSITLDNYVRQVRKSPAAVQLAFVDPSLAIAPAHTRAVLDEAAQAPVLSQHLAALAQVNPVYRALGHGLAAYRAQWAGLPQLKMPPGPALGFGASGERVRLLRLRLGVPAAEQAPNRFDEVLEQAVRRFQAAHGLLATGHADLTTLAALNAGASHYERLIEANLERARALPPVAARRFILVNVPAGRLWLYEGGQVKDSMRIVAGAADEQTPMMAGLISHAVFNPYWNIPVDMVRDSIAPKVLAQGLGYFRTARLQALSDWEADARELDPASIDWAAVAAGDLELRVRQRPGGDNMMGSVKFMLPNELGIYLHDTPDRSAFGRPDRLLSAGCVRVERASDLAAWLIGGRRAAATVGQDQRVDLAEPTPVYITYLTAAPDADGVAFHPDVYNQDPALLAQIARLAGRAQAVS